MIEDAFLPIKRAPIVPSGERFAEVSQHVTAPGLTKSLKQGSLKLV